MLALQSFVRRAALAVALAVAAAPGSGQAQDTLDVQPGGLTRLSTLGSDADDRARVDQLLGRAPADGWLLRSPSSTAAPLRGGRGPLRWALVAPELSLSWNSALPWSQNDGPAWAGKGVSVWALAGVRVEYGRVFAVAAPQVGMAQNRNFGPLLPVQMEQDSFTPPWYRAPDWYPNPSPADLPLRFGDEPIWAVHPGQSTLGVHLGRVDAGVSTENQWWGPGIRNAIVMSSNAPGFPHLFLRTASPWRTRAGAVEAKLILGALGESEQFRDGSADGVRSLSGLVATFSPAAEPDLTLGISRTVQSAVDGVGSVFPRGADVLLRWPSASPDSSDARATQLLSLFGRWIFPREGLEVYAEWARHEMPESFGDFLDYPNHSQGYTLGLQWATRVGVGPDDLLRLQTEVTSLEQSASFRVRPVGSFYTSTVVPQGYTHRGQVIGAAIGPGASSQWAAADWLRAGGRLGVFVGRVRWDNDAFLTTPRATIYPWAWLAHDVSLSGGVRAGLRLPAFQVDAELATTKRYNYLYQNAGHSWETAEDGVDVRNHTLRLTVTPAVPRRRPVVVPEAPPPPPYTGRAVPMPADSAVAPVPFRAARPDSVVAVPPLPADTLRPSTPPVPPVTAAPPRTHRVQPGETLYGIARRYGVRVEELRAANRLAGDAVRAGQELVIPAPR
ncbi:MAG TPA: LysM peptidoglycan-binding domain-containing protein [Longimicrobiaceae bacterium]|nr:LysM peptidoglycan-binding domain-containing protein [Longimicrobiaceae bacterium]